jgi:hypothetical protein
MEASQAGASGKQKISTQRACGMKGRLQFIGMAAFLILVLA